MKTSSIIAAAALSLIASGTALAQEATYEYPQPVVSAKTRAQVQDELVAARADGSIKAWSTSYNPLALAKSELSRDSVKAEARQAVASAAIGEDSGSFVLSRQQPARSVASLFARNAQ